MRRLWEFFARPQNLALLLALGGAFAFLWHEVIHPLRSSSTSQPIATSRVVPAPSSSLGASQTAVARDGGSAVNLNGQGNVTVSNGKDK